MNPQNSRSLVSGNPYLDCPRKNNVTLLFLRCVEDVAPYKLTFALPLVGEGLAPPAQKQCYFPLEHLIRQSPEIPILRIAALRFDCVPPCHSECSEAKSNGEAAQSATKRNLGGTSLRMTPGDCHLPLRGRLTAWRTFATLFVGTGVLDCPRKNDVTFLWNTSSVNRPRSRCHKWHRPSGSTSRRRHPE